MTPLHNAVFPSAKEARRSKAQSGLLKATALLAPTAGATDKDCQSLVPVRRMDSEDMPAPVALTSVKFSAPAKAGEELIVKVNAAKKMMRIHKI